MTNDPLLTIGWKEYVDFLDWGIRRVKAKIDTGARTSALDVNRYELYEDPGNGLHVRMQLRLHRRRPHRTRLIQAPVLRIVTVKNTSGLLENRPLIQVRLQLGPVVKIIPVTLTNRADMRFAMILGRKAIEGEFVVDVGRKYLMKLHDES